MNEYAVIPQPASIKYTEGNFKCEGLPAVFADAGLFENEVDVFNIQTEKNFDIKVCTNNPACIRLLKTETPEDEGYRMEIIADEIRISSATSVGMFRGLQVLRQIFLSHFDDGVLSIPCGVVEDRPCFPWRGLMLDCARNFFSVEFIKKLLDSLCLHHISIFHWHLTDDQGWRLPVKKYPLLTELGSKRYDGRERSYSQHFYTEAEIREIVAYAAARHIEVVPEVDLPGHTNAALAAYPELGCTGGPYKVEERFGVFEDVLCAGNDGLFDLAQAVFETLADLFPSKYVHIGGDEVKFNRWNECPKCQKRIAELKLDGAPQLQSWITFRLTGLLAKYGKIAIGWDEILENTEKFPLPENAVVMSWRGSAGGNKAAELGRRVVMSPNSGGCYLDHKHIDDPEELGRKWVGTVAKAFNLTPITDEMGVDASSLVLGGQGNLWTETVYAGKLAEYLIFPRICAISEALWTADKNRDIADFHKRLLVHRRRLDGLGLLHYTGPLE